MFCFGVIFTGCWCSLEDMLACLLAWLGSADPLFLMDLATGGLVLSDLDPTFSKVAAHPSCSRHKFLFIPHKRWLDMYRPF